LDLESDADTMKNLRENDTEQLKE